MAPPKRSRSIESQFLSPLLPALRALCELLKKSRKQGIIIGGVASSLLGQARLTIDIDATVMIEDKEVDRFLAQAATLGLAPRIKHPAEFMRRSAMLLLRHDATGIPIDLNQTRIPFEVLAVKRAKMKRRGGINIPVPTPEDLIVMKAIAHRPKDLEDIRGIAESHDSLDRVYLQKHIQEFGNGLDMPALWNEISQLIKKKPPRRGRRTSGRGT
jgi:hypothetical protein